MQRGPSGIPVSLHGGIPQAQPGKGMPDSFLSLFLRGGAGLGFSVLGQKAHALMKVIIKRKPVIKLNALPLILRLG
jgi:hypothetical protein